MKQTTRKLLSLLLALVMALSLAVPAFADEGEPPEKELRFAWLMQNESGFFAEDIVLDSKDNPFEGGLGMNPAGDRYVIFFIWNNKDGKRENFVVPKGDGNITVTKLAADEIAKGAKETSYYVKLHMSEFKDGEVTANGLSFPVGAGLDDFGFYSAETPSAESILGGELAAKNLAGNTLYFCASYMGTDEAGEHDAVTKAEKSYNADDPMAKFFDLTQVKEGVWKITINDAGQTVLKLGGSIGINLKLEVKQPDGNTREDGRLIIVRGEQAEQGPSLWVAYPDWNEDGIATCNLESINNGTITSWLNYPNSGLVVGTCDTDNDGRPMAQTFKPIAPSELTASKGLTLNTDVSYKNGDKYGKYYFNAVVDAMDQAYTISYKEYSITVSSQPMDLDIYKTPYASAMTKAGIWGAAFNPVNRDQPYYIVSTATDAGNGRHLTDAKLAGGVPDNALVDLEKVSDSVYKLTIKKTANLERDGFLVKLDLTWADFMGNTWTEPWDCEFKSVDGASVVTSSAALTDGTKADPELLAYSAVAGKLSTEITMNVGEKKDVYLYLSRFFGLDGEQPSWKVWPYVQHGAFHASSAALTITEDGNDFSKFTLSASQPGTYEIYLGGQRWDYENIKLFHAGGKEYTAAEYQKFHRDVGYYADNDGVFYVMVDRKEVPFEEAYPGEKYEIKSLGMEDYGLQRVTVTVQGETKTFTDVKASDWFYKEVNWAVAQGIAAGTGATTFSPANDCTHAEILTFLWRAAGKPSSTAKLPFTPKSAWAADALAWAYEKGMIGDKFDETAKCTSADAVNYIWQAKGKPAASYDGRFTDVPRDAAYAEAVAWAVDAGVTVGTTSTTFAPAAVCSRGRIATFLFRAFSK